MNNQDLIRLRNGNFEIQDFDADELIAVLAFDNDPELHNVRFFSADVMECAMSAPYGLIEGYDEPRFEGDDYRVHEYQGNMDRTVKITFPMWWEGVSGTEKEKLIKSAIMLGIEYDLKRITNKIEVSQRTLAA